MFTTNQSVGRCCCRRRGIVNSACEYYSRFLPKRKKKEGGERRKSPWKTEAESGGRAKPAGKFQSKVASRGSFSPWKINLHLILLRNCSSRNKWDRCALFSFKSPEEPRGADGQGIKTRKLDFTRISELRFLCLIELALLGAASSRTCRCALASWETCRRGRGAPGLTGGGAGGFSWSPAHPEVPCSFPADAAEKGEAACRGWCQGPGKKGQQLPPRSPSRPPPTPPPPLAPGRVQ